MAEATLEKQGLTVAEASHVAGIGRTKLYEAMADGRLKARKMGKRRLIFRDDLRKFLQALPSAA